MSKKVKISAVVITFNEEHNIARCLTSLLDVCDEIIVVDSYSSDRTKTICAEFDVKFIEHHFKGHIEQKNFAMGQASSDYVLSLDADEALSQELKSQISRVKNNWQGPAYKFNRFTNYCGQWIKHCGWYPDTKVRLWDRKKGKWGGLNPHDSVELEPSVTPIHLKGNLLHYSYYSVQEHFERSLKYAKISARAMQQKEKKAGLGKIMSSTIYRFVRDYFIRLGILDGFYGLVICTTNAYTTFAKYVYLREYNRKTK